MLGWFSSVQLLKFTFIKKRAMLSIILNASILFSKVEGKEEELKETECQCNTQTTMMFVRWCVCICALLLRYSKMQIFSCVLFRFIARQLSSAVSFQPFSLFISIHVLWGKYIPAGFLCNLRMLGYYVFMLCVCKKPYYSTEYFQGRNWLLGCECALPSVCVL